jgi:hypothetical protein
MELKEKHKWFAAMLGTIAVSAIILMSTATYVNIVADPKYRAITADGIAVAEAKCAKNDGVNYVTSELDRVTKGFMLRVICKNGMIAEQYTSTPAR